MSHRHQTAPRSWAALFFLLLSYTTGFSSPYQTRKQQSSSLKAILDRRSWLTTTIASSAALLNPLVVVGAEEGEEISAEATAVLLPAVEMRKFVDPVGYFEIVVPKRFFAIRRNNKGDLPDASTGQGRRGSSIFSAGDLSKAEVVAVERYGLIHQDESFMKSRSHVTSSHLLPCGFCFIVVVSAAETTCCVILIYSVDSPLAFCWRRMALSLAAISTRSQSWASLVRLPI